MRSRAEHFLSTYLASAFPMRCIVNAAGIKMLAIIVLMFKESVCIVWVQLLREVDASLSMQAAVLTTGSRGYQSGVTD